MDEQYGEGNRKVVNWKKIRLLPLSFGLSIVFQNVKNSSSAAALLWSRKISCQEFRPKLSHPIFDTHKKMQATIPSTKHDF